MKAFTLLIPVVVFVSAVTIGCSKDNTGSTNTPAETQAPAPATEYNAQPETAKDDVLPPDPVDESKGAEMTIEADETTEQSEEDPSEIANDFEEAED